MKISVIKLHDRLIIIENDDKSIIRVVDISDGAHTNIITSTIISYFKELDFSFDLYHMDEEMAKYYGVKTGYYLSLCFFND